jgi:PAS domain S-box-containing protein
MTKKEFMTGKSWMPFIMLLIGLIITVAGTLYVELDSKTLSPSGPAGISSEGILVLTGGLMVSCLLFALFSSLINTRKQANKIAEELTIKLSESEKRYHTLVELSPEAIAVHRHRKLIYVNPAAIRMIGAKSELDLIGKNILDLVQPENHQLVLNGLQSITSGGIQEKRAERKLIRLDGTVIDVELQGTLIHYDGEPAIHVAMHDITLRKIMENELLAEKKLLSTILENIPDQVYCKDSVSRFILGNPSAALNCGVSSSEEMIGKTDFDFFPENLAKQYFEDEQLIMRSGDSLINHEEIIINKKNQEVHWNLTTKIPVKDSDGRVTGLIGINRDITDIKLAGEALRKSEEKLRVLFKTMPTGFYRSTPEGYYVEANPAMVEMLGYDSEEELLKVHIPTCIYVEAAERDVFVKENEDFTNNLEVYRLKTKDNRIIWVEDNARYIKDVNGRTLFHEGLCREITSRKQAEAEINSKNLELVKINAEKDKFFSIIAHDLRSPFNAFLGFTRMMAENLNELSLDDIKKIAVVMSNSATNLYNLLENLLEWSQLQRGLIKFKPVSFLLLPRVSECILSIIEPADKKGLEISYDIAENISVFADANMFASIIRNLVSNSVKFTPKSGKIMIRAKISNNNSVEISISDTGIGMKKELIRGLFHLDEKTNRKGTEGEPSTGLGLIICKDFIEKHGGTIWVESEEGKGSNFHFILPLNTIA